MGYVSISAIVVALCFASVLTSVGVSVGVFTTSCDSALGKTRDDGDAASGACFDLAEVNLEDKAVKLLGYGSAAIMGRLRDYFAFFTSEVEKLRFQYQHTDAGQNLSDFEVAYARRNRLSNDAFYLAPRGLALKGMVSRYMMLIYANVPGTGSVYYANRGEKEWDSFYGFTNASGEFMFEFPALISSQEDVSVRAIVDGVVNDEIAWSSLYSVGSFIGVALVSVFPDPVSGSEVILFVSLSLPKVDEKLREIALDMQASSSAVVRVFSLSAYSILSEKYALLGPSFDNMRKLYNDTYKLTGVSHGAAAQQFPSNQSNIPTSTPLYDIEASDPLIQQLAWAVHNVSSTAYEAVYSMDSNGSMLIETHDMGRHFMQVSRLSIQYGLEWWLVTTVDYEYIMGEVTRLQEETRTNVMESKANVEDEVSRDRSMGYGIVAATGAFICGVSFVAVYLALRPLNELKANMSEVAAMNLENTDKLHTSHLSEVSSMQSAFHRMVANLKEFRAYVPNAVLSGNGGRSISPPTGDVCIVFTDIEKSTELWARASNGMNQAIEQHNAVMRSACEQHSGYEVKTIGDAFMVAFKDLYDGLRFCMDVQSQLVEEVWSPELDLPPLSIADGKPPIWNGLKVRMGCNYGEAVNEENPLTGRADYRGSTVNMASRLEGKAQGGSICIAKHAYALLKGHEGELGSPAVVHHGVHELKGLGMDHELFLVLPANLSDRLTQKGIILGDKYSPHLPYNMSLDSPTSTRKKSAGSEAGMSSCATPRGRKESHQQGSTHPSKTGLSLFSDQVTVAVCKLLDARNDCIFDNCNTMVRLVVEAASQTDGVVGSVTGRTMTIVWNTSKPCKLHTTAALRFAAQLERRSSKIMRIGVATGEMLYGNVGTQKKRFHTTFGRPLEAAEAAADHALHLGTFCLLADCTTDCKVSSNAAISPFVRLVDMWMDEETDRQIILLELMAEKLILQLEDAWGTVSASDPELEQHNARVAAAIAGDRGALEALKQACVLEAHDAVLKAVTMLLVQITEYKATHRVRVRFSGLPEGVFPPAPVPGSSSARQYPVSPRKRGLSRASVSPPPGALASPPPPGFLTSPPPTPPSQTVSRPAFLALPP